MQVNTIKIRVSKASDDKINESGFEKILFEIKKYRKKVVTYRSFDEVHLEFDKVFPRPGSKSESYV